MERQFQSPPKEWEIYCKQMDDQLARGVAHLMPQDEMANDVNNGREMWFLPHFGVLKDPDTIPIRVVYDGRSRYQGHSLNDYLPKVKT